MQRGDSKINILDGFEWEQTCIQKIQNWIKSQNLTIGEAFKIIDADFDGKISIPDLRKFLIEVLKIESDSTVQNTKMERLYRIIDQSKSGKIF